MNMTQKYTKIDKVPGYDGSEYHRKVQGIWENIHLQYCAQLMTNPVSMRKHGDDAYLVFESDADALLFQLSKDVGEIEEWVSIHFKSYVSGW